MPRSLPRCPPGFTDHIFTTAHGVNLPLRVWPPARGKSPLAADLTASGGVPWLLWVHGGERAKRRKQRTHLTQRNG